jgi:hypothetical protein
VPIHKSLISLGKFIRPTLLNVPSFSRLCKRMISITTRKTGRASQLAVNTFIARHEREYAESDEGRSARQLDELFPGGRIPLGWLMKPSPERDAWILAKTTSPDHVLMNRVKGWWLVRLLRAAGRENSAEAYRELLEDLLFRLGSEAPEGG